MGVVGVGQVSDRDRVGGGQEVGHVYIHCFCMVCNNNNPLPPTT